MKRKGRIGQFEILERLGEGGIGQVYSGHDALLHRQVAIKSLRPELLDDQSFVERFLAEAKNLARLSHPNITTLYSLFQETDHVYMIMELVRGRTLEAILHESAGFAPQEALAIIGQAADGLAYAHEMGVVHRDVKPANLILTDSGLLKIMDFGIAHAEGSQRLTRHGSVVGTLAYMSPEQCRGQEVDGRSDLYSLAVVLYELLTGKAPFSAPSDYDLMQAHIGQTPEPPSRRVAGIAPHVEKALLKALAKRPEDRFDNVKAFKEALGAPTSRTEAASIVRGVTRLLTPSALVNIPTPNGAASGGADAARLSRISPAVGGGLIGAAAAFVLAAALFAFLDPSQPEPTAVAEDLAPAKPMAPTPVAAADPNFLPAPPTDRRAFQPAPPARTPVAEASAAPVEGAAAPRSAGPPAQSAEKLNRSTATQTPPAPLQAKPAPMPPQTPEQPLFSTKDAVAAYEARDYAAARQKAEPCAKSGDAQCEFILGRLFEHGEGGEKNLNIAVNYYRKAAEAGHEKASYNLGVLYYSGEGVPKNLASAAEWFIKAAYKSYAKAELNLAMLYENGEGVPKDLSRARYWYAEAAKSSDPLVAETAQQALGQIGGPRKR